MKQRCQDGKGQRHEHDAEGWLVDSQGHRTPGPGICRMHAEEVIAEYAEAIGERWSFESDKAKKIYVYTCPPFDESDTEHTFLSIDDAKFIEVDMHPADIMPSHYDEILDYVTPKESTAKDGRRKISSHITIARRWIVGAWKGQLAVVVPVP